jgi:hypothetical protein
VRGNIRPERPSTHVFRLAGIATFLALVALIVAGCGDGGASTASSSTSPAGITAYLNCLREHGVNVPTAPPSAAPGSGGFGGAGFGSDSTAFQQAAEACAALRPSGGFGRGFGGGGFAAAFEAFRSCMSSHGEAIPATRPTSPPAAGSPPIDRVLNGLNPSNPSVAAALKACESKLPSFFQSS